MATTRADAGLITSESRVVGCTTNINTECHRVLRLGKVDIVKTPSWPTQGIAEESRSQARRSNIKAVTAFMNLRVAVIVGGVALFAVWLLLEMGVAPDVSAARGNVSRADRPAAQSAAPSAQGADLDSEMARLSAQLRMAPRPQVLSRNPFALESSLVKLSENVPAEPVTSPPSPLSAVASEPAEAAVVGIALVGVGTELGPAERPRTAILSTEGRVVLGRVGDEISGRYQVRAVASDTVELLDWQSGEILRLTLP